MSIERAIFDAKSLRTLDSTDDVEFFAAVQVDYDLSFPEAGYSSAALSVPFKFESSRQSLTIAMWVQFSRHDEPGTFFTVYRVS